MRIVRQWPLFFSDANHIHDPGVPGLSGHMGADDARRNDEL
jgi:hypothetical protein